jgi:hypothetical protein
MLDKSGFYRKYRIGLAKAALKKLRNIFAAKTFLWKLENKYYRRMLLQYFIILMKLGE